MHPRRAHAAAARAGHARVEGAVRVIAFELSFHRFILSRRTAFRAQCLPAATSAVERLAPVQRPRIDTQTARRRTASRADGKVDAGVAAAP